MGTSVGKHAHRAGGCTERDQFLPEEPDTYRWAIRRRQKVRRDGRRDPVLSKQVPHWRSWTNPTQDIVAPTIHLGPPKLDDRQNHR